MRQLVKSKRTEICRCLEAMLIFRLVCQAAFDKATTGASGSMAAALGAGGEAWSYEAMSMATTTKMMSIVKAEQAKTAKELESAQKELVESKTAVKGLERAVAERVGLELRVLFLVSTVSGAHHC